MDIRHPDSLEFIKSKRDLKKLTGANISVKLHNDFMEAVKNDEDYYLCFPINDEHAKSIYKTKIKFDCEYDKLIDLGEGAADIIDGVITQRRYIKKIKAKEYWKEIIKSAHNVAEAGILFEDNLINYSPDGVYDEYRGVTTNP